MDGVAGMDGVQGVWQNFLKYDLGTKKFINVGHYTLYQLWY